MISKMWIRRLWLGGLLALLVGLAACSPPNVPPPTQALSSPSNPVSSTPEASPGLIPSVTTPAQEPTSAVTSAPQAPQPLAYPLPGVEMNAIDPGGGLDLVAQIGAAWVRRNALLWSDVEPQEGVRDWGAVSGLEQELKNAAENGLQVILIVRSAPDWAQQIPGISCGPVKADKLAAFASFLKDAVARYSVSPYNVKYWELGNEPDIDPRLVPPDNIFGCWGNADDPYNGGGYYAQMLQAVYPQVKAADPQSQVVVGGLLLDCDPINPPESPAGSGQLKDCSASRFLEGILKNGGGDFFDGVSFHAYDGYLGALGQYGNPNWHSAWNLTGPVLIPKARYLRSLLASYAHPEKFLMNTEVALLCGRDGKEPACQTEDFNQTKAYYAVQANAAALAEGLRANVWYSVFGWRASGLVDDKGNPLPVYQAYQFSAAQLKGAAYDGEVSDFPGVKGYAFNQDGKRIWLLWSLDGEAHSVSLDTQPTAVYDAFGKPVQGAGQEMQLGVAPVYVEWNP